jgi:hypothetical protein
VVAQAGNRIVTAKETTYRDDDFMERLLHEGERTVPIIDNTNETFCSLRHDRECQRSLAAA